MRVAEAILLLSSDLSAIRARHGASIKRINVEEFATLSYDAKFHFGSRVPGHVGDRYVLQGTRLTNPVLGLMAHSQSMT